MGYAQLLPGNHMFRENGSFDWFWFEERFRVKKMKSFLGYPAIALIYFTVQGCDSPPQTREEFAVLAKKEFAQIPFKVEHASFLEAKHRLLKYAERCLSYTVTRTSSVGSGFSGAYSIDRMTLNPSFEDGETLATLYIQTDMNGTKIQKVPKGGWYTEMFQLTQDSTHTQGVVYYYQSRFAGTLKRIAEYGVKWMVEDSKLCPKP